jgi:TetR/AcrR family tetracycline transcriptional repressor
MLAHRDGALLASASRPAVDRWKYLESILTVLRKAGFTPPVAMRGVGTLTNYVLGTTLEEQQALNRGNEVELPDLDAHPMLRQAIADGVDYDRMFEYGLSLILAGMRAQLP